MLNNSIAMTAEERRLYDLKNCIIAGTYNMEGKTMKHGRYTVENKDGGKDVSNREGLPVAPEIEPPTNPIYVILSITAFIIAGLIFIAWLSTL